MSEFDPEAMYRKLVQAGEEWTDKEAAADILEQSKKTVLAELMNTMEGPTAERERRALAEPTFKLHLAQMSAARKEANRARVRYDACKVLAEMRRTQESTRRMEVFQR